METQKENTTNLVIGVVVVMVAVVAVFIWNNYQIQISPRVEKPINLPNPISKECGIENCHGLDIVCGSKPAQMCTDIYMLGDRCREFAECGVVNGTCQQIENAQFTECKACAQKCEFDSPNDPSKAMECESECGELN